MPETKPDACTYITHPRLGYVCGRDRAAHDIGDHYHDEIQCGACDSPPLGHEFKEAADAR